MQFKQGSQSRCSIWVAVFWFFAAIVSLGDSLSVAQESSVQDGYIIESFPAEGALATSEANGHSFVKQPLIATPEFGLKELLYTIVVVEVPTENASPIVKDWNLTGSSTRLMQKSNAGYLQKSAVVPTSATGSATTFEVRISDTLSNDQLNELIGLGKVISSPEIVGQNGAEVHVRLGHEVPFVASYEPVKDQYGNDSSTMQPMVVKILDGIHLNLTGALADNQKSVRLGIEIEHSQLKGMTPFTFESGQGPLTVQQPDVSVSGISTVCQAPVNKTIALCSGPIVRELVVEKNVPMIGRIPYVGKLFKKTVKATESISTILLIRCQKHTTGRP